MYCIISAETYQKRKDHGSIHSLVVHGKIESDNKIVNCCTNIYVTAYICPQRTACVPPCTPTCTNNIYTPSALVGVKIRDLRVWN